MAGPYLLPGSTHMKKAMLKARNAVLQMSALSDLTGREFEKVPNRPDKPKGDAKRLRGFGKAFGVAGTGATVLSYPVDVWNYGWEEASKSAVDSLLDPFGMHDDLNGGRSARCVLWGEGCPAPATA